MHRRARRLPLTNRHQDVPGRTLSDRLPHAGGSEPAHPAVFVLLGSSGSCCELRSSWGTRLPSPLSLGRPRQRAVSSWRPVQATRDTLSQKTKERKREEEQEGRVLPECRRQPAKNQLPAGPETSGRSAPSVGLSDLQPASRDQPSQPARFLPSRRPVLGREGRLPSSRRGCLGPGRPASSRRKRPELRSGRGTREVSSHPARWLRGPGTSAVLSLLRTLRCGTRVSRARSLRTGFLHREPERPPGWPRPR